MGGRPKPSETPIQAPGPWPYVASRNGDVVAFGLLCLTVLVWEAGSGNIGVVFVALVMHTTRGRFGTVAIGAFASLMFFPVLYALAYVRQREWRRAALAAVVAVVLVAPTLLEDLSHYPFSAGSTISLFGISPVPIGPSRHRVCSNRRLVRCAS